MTSVQCFSDNNIEKFGRRLGELILDGYEIQNSGMSMGSMGPVWWAIMIKETI